MKMKKLISLIMVGAMTLSIAACGSKKDGAEGGKDDKKITVWAWDAKFNIQAMEEAKALYQKDHPDVEIEIVEIAQEDVVQKLNTNLSSNTTTGLPNIVLVEDMRSQNFLTSYPDQFKDLSDKIDASNFMDYKLSVTSYEGKQYGIPFDSGVTALFYRSDIIKEAGFTDEDMQNITWDRYIEIGKVVKEKTGKDMLTLDPNDLGPLRMMMQSKGAWYVKEDGKTVSISDNDVLKKAIETYKKLINAGITKENSGWDQFVGAFNNGDVASVPSGCWVSSSVKAAEDQSGNWKVAPIPRIDMDGAINASNLGGSSWYVLDKVGNSDLAADFMASTFGSSAELMNKLQNDINLISTLKSSADTENAKKAVEFYGGQSVIKDLTDLTAKIPAVNYGLYTYTIEDILSGSIHSIVKENANIDEVLKDVQAQAEGAVSK